MLAHAAKFILYLVGLLTNHACMYIYIYIYMYINVVNVIEVKVNGIIHNLFNVAVFHH